MGGMTCQTRQIVLYDKTILAVKDNFLSNPKNLERNPVVFRKSIAQASPELAEGSGEVSYGCYISDYGSHPGKGRHPSLPLRIERGAIRSRISHPQPEKQKGTPSACPFVSEVS